MAKKADYLGLDKTLSLILAILPPTAWVLGMIVRFEEKHYLATVLRFFFGWNIVWILDLVFMIKEKHILRLLEM